MKVMVGNSRPAAGWILVAKSLIGALIAAGLGVFLFLYTRIEGLGIGFLGSVFSLITPKVLLAAALIFLVSGATIFLCCRFSDVVGEFLYRFRYPIALAILIVCVACNLNGSSIGTFAGYLPQGQDTGLLLGGSKAIRSDEWALNTPMEFAQYYNKEGGAFAYFNTTMRGDVTDSFILYGQPVWDIAVLFRPFHWGYLLLGPVYGLSFFWCARLIALLMVTFEFSMLLTQKRRALSIACALLVAFSSQVQWWYAINGLVEMLVFGQLAILIVHHFLMTDKVWARVLLMPALAICGGGYILTFYPSWQIPLGYVFLALLICVIILDRKKTQFCWKRDVPILLIFVLLLGGGMAYVLSKSLDTVLAVTHSAFPGNRIFTGGDAALRLFSYPATLFFPIYDQGVIPNVCEAAVFFDFFPMGLVLSLLVLFRDKKRDPMLLGLLIVGTFLFAFCAFSWPETLAKLTFLSNCQPGRVFLALGFVNILILMRSMSLVEKRLSTGVSIAAAVVITGAVLFVCRTATEGYLGNYKAVLAGILLVTGCFLIFRQYQKAFAVLCAVVVFFSGMLVNPVRQGADVVVENPLYQSIREITEENDGNWMVETLSFPLTNLSVMAGAPTINSTNVYPNLEFWRQLDSTGESEDVYNRYAHISMMLTEEETAIELMGADNFFVELNVEDLSVLGVRYLMTNRDLTVFDSETAHFTEVAQVDNIMIFEYEGVEK